MCFWLSEVADTIISIFRMLRQEDYRKMEDNLGYRVKPWLQNETTEKKGLLERHLWLSIPGCCVCP